MTVAGRFCCKLSAIGTGGLVQHSTPISIKSSRAAAG